MTTHKHNLADDLVGVVLILGIVALGAYLNLHAGR